MGRSDEEVSVNIPASAVDSVDELLTWVGLPEVDPLVERVSPANVAETLGIPTLEDVGDELREGFDDLVDFRMDDSRR